MANHKDKTDFPVTFVGLETSERAPRFAAYRLDVAGRPVAKVGHFDGKTLELDAGGAASVAFGPDVEDYKTLPPESLVSYRLTQNIQSWQERGVVLAHDVWKRFLLQFVCVTGTVRKCPAIRPEDVRALISGSSQYLMLFVGNASRR